MYTGLKAGVNEKSRRPRCQTRHAPGTTIDHGRRCYTHTHTLTRQSFETEREQILQRPIVVDLYPKQAAQKQMQTNTANQQKHQALAARQGATNPKQRSK